MLPCPLDGAPIVEMRRGSTILGEGPEGPGRVGRVLSRPRQHSSLARIGLCWPNGLRLDVVVSIVPLKRGQTSQSTSDEHRTRSRFRVFHLKVRAGCVGHDRIRADERERICG